MPIFIFPNISLWKIQVKSQPKYFSSCNKKKKIFVEANAKINSAKFQFYSPYGFLSCFHMDRFAYVIKFAYVQKYILLCVHMDCKNHEQERDEDRRRDGKITSRNGQEWGMEIPRTAEDRKGWKGIVATSSVMPQRPPRLRD